MTLCFVFILASLAACGGAAPSGEPSRTLAPLAEREPISDGVSYALLRDTVFADAVTPEAKDWSWEANESGVTVLKYLGSAQRIAIPATLDGKPVTAVADRAFADRETLTAVLLPDSVTSIGEGILAGCTSLEALRTPLLGANAKADAFLGYLFGGDSYTDNAMKVPATLEFLEVGGDMTKLPSYALFDCNDLRCLWFSNALTAIEDYALFGCASLKYLPTEDLETLGSYALFSCSSLLQLELPQTLTSIGFGALEGCRSLRRLVLPFVGGSATENTYLGFVFGASVPDFSRGYYPASLQEVVVLEGCTALGNYAFYECQSLQCVTLPEGLTSVGVRAFAECVSLVELRLPTTLTTLRENSFFGCVRLETLELGATALNSVGVNAFYDCISLTRVTLPDTLKELPASCFAGCVALQTLDLGGVTRVGKNALHRCDALSSVSSKEKVLYEDGNDAAERLK